MIIPLHREGEPTDLRCEGAAAAGHEVFQFLGYGFGVEQR
jgi:hypothetical protein